MLGILRFSPKDGQGGIPPPSNRLTSASVMCVSVVGTLTDVHVGPMTTLLFKVVSAITYVSICMCLYVESLSVWSVVGTLTDVHVGPMTTLPIKGVSAITYVSICMCLYVESLSV